MVRATDGRILEGWAKTWTAEDVPLYANHAGKLTQWDHPEYVRIMEESLGFNSIIFAAYRTAFKIRDIQTKFKLHEVPLQCVASGFDSAGLHISENADFVSISKIEVAVSHIFRTSFRNKPVDSSLCTDLAINLLLNAYDQNRTGNLLVLSCKILLVVLCGGRLQEKYRYLFLQVADHNNCCTRKKLAAILRDLARIPEMFSEHPSFGISLVASAVDSCFGDIEGDIGITEDLFLNWLHQEPQTLVWWTTLYRSTAAEMVCHDVKCNVCKQSQVVGLRYKCLRCLRYNLCQDCFLHGRTSRSHKVHHPTQEYCQESTPRENRQAFLKTMTYRLKKSKPFKPRYLSISTISPTHTLGSLLQETEAETPQRDLDMSSWGPGKSSDLSPSGTSRGATTLMLRTIYQSMEDLKALKVNLNDALGSCGSVSVGGERGLSKASSESALNQNPYGLPTSPRNQIQSVILHLQSCHKQLMASLESSAAERCVSPLIYEHSSNLSSEIMKLKRLLQNYKVSRYALSGESKLLKVSHQLPALESTPVASERSSWPNFSPIGSTLTERQQTLTAESAILDNKENHKTETNKQRTDSGTGTGSGTDAGTPGTSPVCHEGTARTPGITYDGDVASESQLPSFTEVNFDDLTAGWRSRFPSQGLDSRNGVEKVEDLMGEETEVIDVRDDLDDLLLQLDDVYPFHKDEDKWRIDHGVLNVAMDIGDIVAGYVNEFQPREERREVEEYSDSTFSSTLQ